MLFNSWLQTSSMSLVNAQNMLKKIYFPRLVLPVSAVMVSLVDLAVQIVLVALVILALPLLPGGVFLTPSPQLILLPIAIPKVHAALSPLTGAAALRRRGSVFFLDPAPVPDRCLVIVSVLLVAVGQTDFFALRSFVGDRTQKMGQNV